MQLRKKFQRSCLLLYDMEKNGKLFRIAVATFIAQRKREKRTLINMMTFQIVRRTQFSH